VFLLKKVKKTKKPIKNQKKADKVQTTPPEKPSPELNKSDNPKQTYEDLLAKLGDRAARFVQEYLVDLIKEKAAQRAGYSQKSARQQASYLMKNTTVLAAIREGKKLIASRAMVNQDEVLKELALIGFADMADFIKVDEGGGVCAIPLEQLKSGASRIIKKIKEKRIIKSCQGSKDKPSEDMILESTYEFELHDKVKSLLGILDRVKPGADDPDELIVTHQLANMPPDFKSIEEWEKGYRLMEKKAKERKD
ncbi:MAG: terminase small subunit, partial [Smithella sp.]